MGLKRTTTINDVNYEIERTDDGGLIVRDVEGKEIITYDMFPGGSIVEKMIRVYQNGYTRGNNEGVKFAHDAVEAMCFVYGNSEPTKDSS